MELNARLTRIVQHYAANKYTPSLAIALSQPRSRAVWQAGAGPSSRNDARPMTGDSPYFIASATKLYTSALIMQLRAEGRLDLEDKISKYLPAEKLRGIHLMEGVDRTGSITIRHLLAHTSGLADYFEQERADGRNITHQIVFEQDRGWTLDDVLEMNRTDLEPKFPPGTPHSAFYSDTNYQLLGAIIESICGATFAAILRDRIIRPLNLTRTYLFTATETELYDSIATMHYGTRPMRVPKAMASFGADGGIVSTANEGIVFLEAFMGGKLFPKEYLIQMTQWNRIFFPIEYGVGIMRFKTPRLFSPFREFPELIGHSGASGTVLYYAPELDLYISATVNQVQKRSVSYRFMMRVVNLFM